MILRKPYGILIKNFKKIHLAILALLCYIIYKSKSMLNFFNLYINSGYTTNESNFASHYFNFFTFLIFAITIASFVAILLLMMSKKKKSLYYLISVIFYSALLVIFIIGRSALSELQLTSIEATKIIVYRDLFNLTYYPQFFFIIYALIRGIGFDIKSFNFNQDLIDLDLLDEDEEEVEVNLNVESYKIKRSTRRTIRELRYYIQENRFVFTCLAVIAAAVAIISLILNFEVYNKRYKINQSFILDTFSVSYKESVLTNRDYQGKIIDSDKFYLATTVHLKNNTNASRKLDVTQLKLVVGNDVIYPTLNMSGRFIDRARAYYGEKIAGGSEADYTIVYELNAEQIKAKYNIKILSSIELGKKEIIPRYKIISLKPDLENSVENHQEITLNEELKLNETPLKETTFKVNSYEINNKFEYTYDFCYENQCYPSKDLLVLDPSTNFNQTLLILDANLDLDSSSFYASDHSVNHNFYNDFVSVTYTKNGTTYTADCTDVTPKKSQGNDNIILKTSNSISNADSISLTINFRNHTYSIKLK